MTTRLPASVNTPLFYVGGNPPAVSLANRHRLWDHPSVRVWLTAETWPVYANAGSGIPGYPAYPAIDPLVASAKVIADGIDFGGYVAGTGTGKDANHDGAFDNGIGRFAPPNGGLLFGHAGDTLSAAATNYPLGGLFCAAGVAETTAGMGTFATALAAELTARGLCKPEILAADFESPPAWGFQLLSMEPTQKGTYPAMVADARAGTEAIVKRGAVTYTLNALIADAAGRGVPAADTAANSWSANNAAWTPAWYGTTLEAVEYGLTRALSDVLAAHVAGVSSSNFDTFPCPGPTYADPYAAAPWRRRRQFSSRLDVAAPMFYGPSDPDRVPVLGLAGAVMEGDATTVAAIREGNPAARIVPWIMAPGNFAGGFLITTDVVVQQCVALVRLGVTEFLVFGGNADWDACLRAIESVQLCCRSRHVLRQPHWR